MGDDDVLLDGAIDRLLAILRGEDYGVVFLNSYAFTNDFSGTNPPEPAGYTIYTDSLAFVRSVAIFCLYVRQYFQPDPGRGTLDWGPFLDSNLVQLAWIFSALFNGKKQVYVSEYLLAARVYNWGGFGPARSLATTSTRFLMYSENGESTRSAFGQSTGNFW